MGSTRQEERPHSKTGEQIKGLGSLADFVAERPENGPPFIKSRGLRFPNDRRIIPAGRRKALRERLYEIATVKPEDVVIELGAGMGYAPQSLSCTHNGSARPGFRRCSTRCTRPG